MPLLTPAPERSQRTIDVRHGTAFELVLSVLLYLDEEEAALFAECARWRERLAERVAPDLDTLVRETLGAEQAQVLLALPLAAGERDARGMADAVAGMRPSDLRAVVAGVKRDALVALLRRWHDDVFAPDERPLERDLGEVAGHAASLARRLPAAEVVERVTNGVQLGTVGDGRRVVLVPTVVLRPWVVKTEWRGTHVVAFPGGGAAEADDAATVARVYRALGDETRLRLLQLLTAEDRTLQELADAAGIVKSTAHHHMAILRDARLVVVDMSDDRRYRLRVDTVASLGQPLRALLGRSGA